MTLSSQIKKRSIKIAGHATSISLEEAFWVELKKIAGRDGKSLAKLVTEIDAVRTGNLSSAIRVFILQNLRN